MDRSNPTIPPYRLPANVLPVSYKLTMKPCFETWTKFDAALECRIKVLEQCQEIVMNCCKLNLKEVDFTTDGNKTMKPEKILHDEENEIVKLFFGPRTLLPTGMATLTIKFEGQIQATRELKGIYLNCWNEKKTQEESFIKDSTTNFNKEKCWIMTKLDMGQCRLAMPCWDEPKFKANFRLEMELPSDMDCLFNSEKEKEEAIKNGMWKRICFKETPIMATSGLCFCVGKFDTSTTMEKNVGGTKIRVCMPKILPDQEFQNLGRKKEWARWTFDTACKLFDLLNKTFQMAKFPGEKLDLMVVPNFAKKGTGAMGLIGIKEEMFWLNEENSPCVKKQKVALLVAKMMAKQWMGNMITVKDWKEIWFEESMCKYLMYYAVDKLWPEWAIWETMFPCRELLPSMRFDMLPTTDPMEMSDEMMKMWFGSMGGKTVPADWLEHNKAGDWDFIEKRCRFSKGCVLLKMIRDFVGEQCFNKTLISFCTKFCFKCATLDEFWSQLEMDCKMSQKPNINFRQLMTSWTEKRAFPLIHCTGKVDSTTGNFMITLKQESVLDQLMKNFGMKMENYHGGGGGSMMMKMKMEEPKLWCIPLGISTDPSGAQQSKMDVVMDKEAISLMVPSSEYRNASGFFKVDPKHSCYAVVCYTEEFIRRTLIPMIERRELKDRMDRCGLLLDVYTCTKVGLYPSDLFLELAKKMMGTEDSVTVWRCMMKCMGEMRKCCADLDFFKKDPSKMMMLDRFNRFMVAMLKDKKGRMDDRWWLTSTSSVGAKMKSDDEEMLMGMWAWAMVECRDPEVERKAVDTFWAWFRHEPERAGKMVSGDMQKACFAAAAQTNDMKVCDAFLKIYKEFKFEEAREYALHGMGYFTDRTIIDKLMNFAMSSGGEWGVPSEDTLRMLKSLTRRCPETREAAWRMMKGRWDFFTTNYDRCRMASDFFEEFITEFCDAQMAEEVAKFARDKISIKCCTRMLQQSCEFAQLKEAWFKRDADTIKRYLEKF